MRGGPTRENVIVYSILVGSTAALLYGYRLTKFEYLLELSALPFEILVTVFILDRFLRAREARAVRQRLRHVKGYLFRSQMRRVFLSNLEACRHPRITPAQVLGADLAELRALRREAERVTYANDDAMERVLAEYANAEAVWKQFMDIAIANDFDDIFQAMLYILHLVEDYRQFKAHHPRGCFVRYAARRPELRAKVEKVLGDGIRAFLDYAIELKQHQPELFVQVFSRFDESTMGVEGAASAPAPGGCGSDERPPGRS